MRAGLLSLRAAHVELREGSGRVGVVRRVEAQAAVDLEAESVEWSVSALYQYSFPCAACSPLLSITAYSRNAIAVPLDSLSCVLLTANRSSLEVLVLEQDALELGLLAMQLVLLLVAALGHLEVARLELAQLRLVRVRTLPVRRLARRGCAQCR